MTPDLVVTDTTARIELCKACIDLGKENQPLDSVTGHGVIGPIVESRRTSFALGGSALIRSTAAQWCSFSRTHSRTSAASFRPREAARSRRAFSSVGVSATVTPRRAKTGSATSTSSSANSSTSRGYPRNRPARGSNQSPGSSSPLPATVPPSLSVRHLAGGYRIPSPGQKASELNTCDHGHPAAAKDPQLHCFVTFRHSVASPARLP